MRHDLACVGMAKFRGRFPSALETLAELRPDALRLLFLAIVALDLSSSNDFHNTLVYSP